MAKKKDQLVDEAEKIKAEIDELKRKTEILEGKPTKKTSKTAKKEEKPAKKTAKKEDKKAAKKEEKPAKKTAKKEDKKAAKKEEKPAKKTAKKEDKKAAKKEEDDKASEKTLEEELEETLSPEEIENFQIEKVDMERLTNKVCEILAEKESEGMFQNELWKKLKLTIRDGSRLALRLERTGFIYREKILENNRWTYKLILKKTPISTLSIENAPCLVCPVEQKCSLDGEISPRSCEFIENWVLADMKTTKSK